MQLVQPDVPVIKGATYLVTFDAYAEEDRIMKVAVTAPTRDWIRYLEDTGGGADDYKADVYL